MDQGHIGWSPDYDSKLDAGESLKPENILKTVSSNVRDDLTSALTRRGKEQAIIKAAQRVSTYSIKIVEEQDAKHIQNLVRAVKDYEDFIGGSSEPAHP